MSLNAEQLKMKALLLKKIKQAQADVEHEVSMYNTVLAEAHASLKDTVDKYNEVCLECERFVEDAITLATATLCTAGAEATANTSHWIRVWKDAECMRQSDIDSPPEVETDCDGFYVMDQLPDSVEDL